VDRVNRTIRDYIKRRVWWCAALGFGGWLIFALGSVIARSMPDGVPRAAIPVVGFVMFGGAIFALQGIVRCPRCKAKLGRTVAMPIAFSWGSGPKVNFCPFCGVSLDERLPGAPNAQDAGRAYNPLDPIK
jgi:hypothetical protein